MVNWGEKKGKKKQPSLFLQPVPCTHCGVSQAGGERSRVDFHLSEKKWKKGESFFHVLQEAAAGTTQRCLQYRQLRPVAASSPRSRLITSSTPHSLALLPWAPSFPVCPSPFQFQLLRWVLLREPPCGRRRECSRTNLKASLLQPQLLANPTA